MALALIGALGAARGVDGPDDDPLRFRFATVLGSVQVLGDQREVWCFVAIDWYIRASLNSSRPSPRATELHVFRFDGTRVTHAYHVRSLKPKISFSPLVYPIMRFGDAFYIVSGANLGKPGTIYRWNGKEVVTLEPTEVARVARQCGLDLRKTESDLKPQMDKVTEQAGWKYLLANAAGEDHVHFAWKGQQYRLGEVLDGTKAHLRLSMPDNDDFKPVDLLTFQGKPRMLTGKEVKELENKIEASLRPEDKKP